MRLFKHPLLYVSLLVIGALVLAGRLPQRVEALGPAPGSVGAQHKGDDRQSEQSASKPRTVKQEKKKQPTEEEKYCPAGERHNDCMIQLRTALATEKQARYALLGFAALVVTLVLSTIATLAATSSARTARKVLTDLERPHVFVEVTESGLRWETSDGSYRLATGRFEHKCVNYGRTAAGLIEYLPDIQVLEAGKFPAPIDPKMVNGRELPTGCVATRDSPYTEGDTAMKTYPSKLLAANASRKYSIYFVGFVRYRDMIFGARYISGFCFLYDEIGARFVRRGNNTQYNYTRRDDPEPATPWERLRRWMEAAHGRAPLR